MARQLTDLEIKIAEIVVNAGEDALWEYSASLKSPHGPLLEIRTEKMSGKANPSQLLIDDSSSYPDYVLHHNHLSGESLGFADWCGASTYFNEIFAHCNDGTYYYGKVLQKDTLLSKINSVKVHLESMAENCLNDHLLDMYSQAISFLRKDVICRAFKIRGYVDYEYQWGYSAVKHTEVERMNINGIISVGQLGRVLDRVIIEAACELSEKSW
ncbi:hypothetical protein QNM34_13755 [Rahnella bonaserana]|uniref:hypothetical protein n=1 Tax=Enterobacterales TaxID=91347 RepID=UPI00155FF664|nr:MULTISPECIES: hypothetical protein [Enterobacterales]NRF74080.1 hypothetical protein [Citrobacter braakii]WHZ39124.1 hypothetical protein QNM34_13755 [Rahnella bonaserana]